MMCRTAGNVTEAFFPRYAAAPPIFTCLVLLSLLFLAVGCPPTPPELITIPTVTGLQREAAEAILEDEGFTMIMIVEQPSTAPEGVVFNQMPAAGSWVSVTTVLTLYVSTGGTPPDINAWSGVYGEGDFNELTDIIPTEDGGYLVTGETSAGDDASRSVLLLKIDVDGEVEWSNTFAVTDTQRGEALLPTIDGGYIIAGYTDTATESGEALLVKVDEDGEAEWLSTFGIENSQFYRAYDVAQTQDGGYLLAGTAMSNPSLGLGFGGRDFLLMKISSIGSAEWHIWYGEAQDDEARALRRTEDGGYIVAGSTASFDAEVRDAFLMKTNINGVREWIQFYGGDDEDRALDVRQTPDGGYIMVGYTNSFDVPYRDIFVVKVNAFGIDQWSRIIDIALLEDDESGSDEIAASIQVTPEGEYVIAGATNAHGGEGSVTMVKLDNEGNLVWHNTVGGMGLDEALAVEVAQDEGYVAVGYTDSFGDGVRHGYIVKTDADGQAFDALGP